MGHTLTALTLPRQHTGSPGFTRADRKRSRVHSTLLHKAAAAMREARSSPKEMYSFVWKCNCEISQQTVGFEPAAF